MLGISIPFALASYAALWPAVMMGSTLNTRLSDKETQARRRLVTGAFKELKRLRVLLDDLFQDYDDGNDPFLTKARPSEVLGPAREFVRLSQAQERMSADLARAQRLSGIAFWFLVAFASLITVTVVTSILDPTIGDAPSHLSLLGSALAFAGGAVIYVWFLLLLRRLDFAHTEAGKIDRAEESDEMEDLNSLSGGRR